MLDNVWAKYAQIQRALSRTTDKSKALALEAALTDLLDQIGEGEIPSSRQAKNLVANRSKRERRREALLDQHAASMPPAHVSNAAEARIDLAQCQAVCGNPDFEMLIAHAQGERYGELATVYGLTESAIKVRMYRARKKLAALAA